MAHLNRVRALKLLLVEDCPSDVWLIREALKQSSLPIQLTLAEDGVQAMEHMEKAAEGKVPRPDLILLDLNLPRKNGREVLSEIKASVLHRQTPVLMMSSSRSEEDIRECYELNANCYITKPASLDSYLEVVKAIEEFWFSVAQLPTPSAA